MRIALKASVANENKYEIKEKRMYFQQRWKSISRREFALGHGGSKELVVVLREFRDAERVPAVRHRAVTAVKYHR
jgi:hypothetical protein